jgi:glutamate synthase domain-containing protein 2
MTLDWATQRLINLFAAWRMRLVEILHGLDMTDIRELVGRTDCLRHLDYEGKSTH